MNINEIRKKLRIAFVVSIIWLCIIFILAFSASIHDQDGFDIYLFTMILLVAGLLPLLLFWGIVWMKAVKKNN